MCRHGGIKLERKLGSVLGSVGKVDAKAGYLSHHHIRNGVLNAFDWRGGGTSNLMVAGLFLKKSRFVAFSFFLLLIHRCGGVPM